MIFVVAFEISFVGTKVRNRPILLRKSAMVSTAEKYAFEIEIFTLSRGFGLRFRVAARKKGIFSSQYMRSLEGPTFSTQSTQSRQSECQDSGEGEQSKKTIAWRYCLVFLLDQLAHIVFEA